MNIPKSDHRPVGEFVDDTTPSPIPAGKNYAGEYVSLHPVDPENDVDDLFQNAHGSDDKERIWTYMPYGPFAGKDEMLGWLNECKASTNMKQWLYAGENSTSLTALNKNLLQPTCKEI